MSCLICDEKTNKDYCAECQVYLDDYCEALEMFPDGLPLDRDEIWKAYAEKRRVK